MERKTFLKVEKGGYVDLTVEEIKKQEVVNLIGKEGMVTLYADQSKEDLRRLWVADKANPVAPLVGKRLRIAKPMQGPMEVSVVTSTPNPDDVPF